MLPLVTLRLDVWAIPKILLKIADGARHDLRGLLAAPCCSIWYMREGIRRGREKVMLLLRVSWWRGGLGVRSRR